MVQWLHIGLYFLVIIGVFCQAEYLKDEDVRLKIYSPESSQNSIALELVIYNRDEEFFVKIVSEDDAVICEGRFSRFSADRVKCSYDTSILKDGDNSFHVTINSVATNEIVLDTVSHFFYEGGSVVPGDFSDNFSEYREIIISIAIILLVFRFGPVAIRRMKEALFVPQGGSSPPPPPNLPILTSPVPDFSPTEPIDTTSADFLLPSERGLRNMFQGKRLLRAALLGAAIILGGKIVTAPFRGRSKPSHRAVPPAYAPPRPLPPPEQSAPVFAPADYVSPVYTQSPPLPRPEYAVSNDRAPPTSVEFVAQLDLSTLPGRGDGRTSRRQGQGRVMNGARRRGAWTVRSLNRPGKVSSV